MTCETGHQSLTRDLPDLSCATGGRRHVIAAVGGEPHDGACLQPSGPEHEPAGANVPHSRSGRREVVSTALAGTHQPAVRAPCDSAYRLGGLDRTPETWGAEPPDPDAAQAVGGRELLPVRAEANPQESPACAGIAQNEEALSGAGIPHRCGS